MSQKSAEIRRTLCESLTMVSSEQISNAFEKISGASAGLHLYALIDHGGMPGLVKQLTSTGQAWVSLFQRSREEGAITVAPILLTLESNPENKTKNKTLNWISERSAFSSSLLLLVSPLSLEDLARRLAKRLDAQLPDNMDVMLRYFDTRIFAELMTVLDAQQKAAFLSPAQQWWYVDRRGVLQTIDSMFTNNDAFNSPLKLTTQQQNTLIENSEPDQIAELLFNNIPNEFEQLPPKNRFDFIQKHRQAAEALNINSTHEKSFYCAIALIQGEDFASQPAWQNGLAQVKSGLITLQKLAQKIEEEDD
jgi:hypothetical protein